MACWPHRGEPASFIGRLDPSIRRVYLAPFLAAADIDFLKRVRPKSLLSWCLCLQVKCLLIIPEVGVVQEQVGVVQEQVGVEQEQVGAVQEQVEVVQEQVGVAP